MTLPQSIEVKCQDATLERYGTTGMFNEEMQDIGRPKISLAVSYIISYMLYDMIVTETVKMEVRCLIKGI